MDRKATEIVIRVVGCSLCAFLIFVGVWSIAAGYNLVYNWAARDRNQMTPANVIYFDGAYGFLMIVFGLAMAMIHSVFFAVLARGQLWKDEA